MVRILLHLAVLGGVGQEAHLAEDAHHLRVAGDIKDVVLGAAVAGGKPVRGRAGHLRRQLFGEGVEVVALRPGRAGVDLRGVGVDAQKQRGVKVFCLRQTALHGGGVIVGVEQVDLSALLLQRVGDRLGKLPVDALLRPVRVDVVRHARVAAAVAGVYGDARPLDAGGVIKAQHDVAVLVVGLVAEETVVVQQLQRQRRAVPGRAGKQRVLAERKVARRAAGVLELEPDAPGRIARQEGDLVVRLQDDIGEVVGRPHCHVGNAVIFDRGAAGHRLHILAVDAPPRGQLVVVPVLAAVLDADHLAGDIVHCAVGQRIAVGVRIDAVLVDREGPGLLGHHLHQRPIPDGFGRGGGQLRPHIAVARAIAARAAAARRVAAGAVGAGGGGQAVQLEGQLGAGQAVAGAV